jgi:hypothetical protein
MQVEIVKTWHSMAYARGHGRAGMAWPMHRLTVGVAWHGLCRGATVGVAWHGLCTGPRLGWRGMVFG